MGGADALEALLGLLTDPFAQREAAEAAAEVALRTGRIDAALEALREEGLGATWRWSARAALGDEAWVRALMSEWLRLAPPFRLQALEASRSLPEALRSRVKQATADATGQAKAAWDTL